MRPHEVRRLTVISKVIEGCLSIAQAAELLQLSTRQVLRIKKRVLEEGETGVIHKNRGRQPSHTLPQTLKQQIVSLYLSDAYRGCNDTHFTELLAEREGIMSARPRFVACCVQPDSRLHANIAHPGPIAHGAECPKLACSGRWILAPSTG